MNPLKYKFAFYPLVFFLILFLSKGCFSELKLEEARDKTEKLFQKELKKENVHNAFLMVYSPSQQIDWNFASGKFQNGEAVTSANPFYTASIGKTFTATTIAILVEQGELNFEDKLSVYLPDLTIVGHSGSTGSFMFYCPELDVYLAGTLNQPDEVKNSVKLMVRILS